MESTELFEMIYREKNPRNISLLTCKVCVCVWGGGGGGEKHKNKYIIYAMLTVINDTIRTDHFVNWKTKLSMQNIKCIFGTTLQIPTNTRC